MVPHCHLAGHPILYNLNVDFIKPKLLYVRREELTDLFYGKIPTYLGISSSF